jgi:hypothetical protein
MESKSYQERASQAQILFEYLQKHTATASMASEATGLKQKNICRYKRDLEKRNLLWEISKSRCKVTGRRAWYLSTDPSKAPINYQLKLFL